MGKEGGGRGGGEGDSEAQPLHAAKYMGRRGDAPRGTGDGASAAYGRVREDGGQSEATEGRGPTQGNGERGAE